MIKFVLIAVMLTACAAKNETPAPAAKTETETKATVDAVKATEAAVAAKPPTQEEIAAAKDAAVKKAAEAEAEAKLEANRAVKVARGINKDMKCFDWSLVQGGPVHNEKGELTGAMGDQALCEIDRVVYWCTYGVGEPGCKPTYNTYTPEERRQLAAKMEAEEKAKAEAGKTPTSTPAVKPKP